MCVWPCEMVAVVVGKWEKRSLLFSLSLFRLLLCHFVLLSYPTQLKFPADVCVLPPPPLSLFLFLHTPTKSVFFFLSSNYPPRASSVSRSAPSRTTKPGEKNTHARSVCVRKGENKNQQTVFTFYFSFLVKRFCFFF